MLYKDGEKYFTQAPEVVNDLTTGGTTKALSAEQGKVLKQTIDNLPQGGHTIKNDSGTSQTQRDNLQFGGVYTHDDSTNNKTEVDIVREFQSVADIEALTGEEAKGFQYLDDDVYDAFTASDIAYDENNSVKDKIDEIDGKLNGTLIKSIPANTYNTYVLALAELETYYNGLTAEQKRHSVLKLNSNVTARLFLDNGRYSYCTIGGTTAYIVVLTLDAHSYEMANMTTNGITFTNNSSQPQAMSLELWVI